MTAILKTNGDLLVPLGECVAAERVTPSDPRYAALLPGAIPKEDLRGTPERDAALLAEFERRFQEKQQRSA